MVTVPPRGDGVAGLASPLPAPGVEVVTTEEVTPQASRLRRVDGSIRLSPKDIDALGYRFEVLRVYAEALATQVINLQGALNRTVELFVEISMGIHEPAADGESAVPSLVGSALPNPVIIHETDPEHKTFPVGQHGEMVSDDGGPFASS